MTRSYLYRCLQRHGISRLPDVEGDKPAKKTFKSYPIGFFNIDTAEVQTAEDKLYQYVGRGRVLHWIDQRWPIVSAARPGTCARCMGRLLIRFKERSR